MKKLTLFFSICMCVFLNANSQQCLTGPPPLPPTTNAGCTTNYLEYLSDPTSIYNEPIMTVRVNIHVMQDTNGAGSFPNSQAAIDFLSGLFGTDPNVTPHTLNFTPYGHIEGPTWANVRGGIYRICKSLNLSYF